MRQNPLNVAPLRSVYCSMSELPLNGPELLVTLGGILGLSFAVLTMEPASESLGHEPNGPQTEEPSAIKPFPWASGRPEPPQIP